MSTLKKVLYSSLCLALIACSKADKKMVGSWTTHRGECRGEGELVIEVHKKQAEVDFMCFAKVCARAKGKIDQAGYFHFKLPKGQMLDGQIMDSFARGNWAMEMEEGYCEGTFKATPIKKR